MKFSYTARDGKGGMVKGTIEAATAREVASQLRQRDLMPVSINQSLGLDIPQLPFAKGSVTGAEVASMTRQLATMITAGLPITDALNLLRLQSSPAFSPILGEMLADVQAGLTLSSTMAKHPSVFSKVYVALVKAGETAGVLETILNRLAENLEKGKELRGKVQGALIYPVIVIIGMLGVMVLMVTVVVPKLSALYADFGSELPWATQLVVSISNFLLNPLGVGFLVVALSASVTFLRWYLTTPVGNRQKDELVLKLPIFGSLVSQVIFTEMCRTMSLLVGAGVSIVETLGIVSGAAGNTIIETEIKVIGKKVERGFPVSVAFGESQVFPALIGQMVAVGEETGKMDEVFAKLAVYFGSDAEEKIKGLTVAIEPLILAVLGAGVGFLMFAIIMPLYNITSQI